MKWQIDVQLTIPVLPEDSTPRYDGDAESDFAARVVDERLRPCLETLLIALGPGAHYYIKEQWDLNGMPLARRVIA